MKSFWLTPVRWLGLMLLSLALSTYTIDVECLTQQGACHDYLFSQQYSDCVSPLIVDRPFCPVPMVLTLAPSQPSVVAPLGQEMVAPVLRATGMSPLALFRAAIWRLRGPPLAA